MGRRGIFVRDAADRITSDSQTRRGGKGGFFLHGSPLSEKRMQVFFFFFWHRTGPSSYWQSSDFVPRGLLRAIYSCRYIQLVQMAAIHQGYQPSSHSHYTSQGRGGGFCSAASLYCWESGCGSQAFHYLSLMRFQPLTADTTTEPDTQRCFCKVLTGNSRATLNAIVCADFVHRGRSDDSLCWRGPSFS